MKFRPLFNKILVIPDKPDTHSKGGLIIPHHAQEKTNTGTVVAVGEGGWDDNNGERIPISVEIGDKLMFHNKAGNEVEIEKVKYLIMIESDIIGVMK